MTSQINKTLDQVFAEESTAAKFKQKVPLILREYQELFDQHPHSQVEPRLLLSTMAIAIQDPDLIESSGILISRLQDFFQYLSIYEKAIYWHLNGNLIWKKEGSYLRAIDHLNRSLFCLQDLNDKKAQLYRSRVHNAHGQIALAHGHLHDAILDFEESLRLREDSDDVYGKALTYGSLGRLYMEIGDFTKAISFLENDVGLMDEHYPEMFHIRAQLFSHLGKCFLEIGDLNKSKEYYQRSIEISTEENLLLNTVHAFLGLAEIMIQHGDNVSAKSLIDLANGRIQNECSGSEQRELLGIVHHLLGLIDFSEDRYPSACENFEMARADFDAAVKISPILKAKILCDLARVKEVQDKHSEAADLLSATLAVLDMTSAVKMRKSVEDELRLKYENSWIRHSARRFMGSDSLQNLLERAGEQGYVAHKNQLAVLFTDIRNYTPFAENLPAEEVVDHVNKCLTRMIRSVIFTNGYVVEILGDALIGVFSLPVSRQDDCERAAIAALVMVEEVRKLNFHIEKNLPEFAIGIGIHYGKVISGLIGSPAKRSYAVIGDTVNTTSRIEGITKLLGVPILVSGDFRERLPDQNLFQLMPVGIFLVVGRTQPVRLYALLGMNGDDPVSLSNKALIEAVENSFSLFYQRQFDEAQVSFDQVYENSGIQAFRFFSDYAQAFKANPPDENWDGTIVLQNK